MLSELGITIVYLLAFCIAGQGARAVYFKALWRYRDYLMRRDGY